jgi:hypothetical protein
VTPLCVDVKGAAALIGVSSSVVRGYIEMGLLPIIKFPSASAKHQGEQSRRVLIAVSDLENFIEQHRVQAVQR